MDKKVIAIIPARGGSLGIPRKNLIEFNKIPLVAYPIIAARSSSLVDRIFVSTDSHEIKLVCKKYGAEVLDRPIELSHGEVSSEDVLLHVLDFLHTTENYDPDIVVFLQCTTPILFGDNIDGAISELIHTNVDCIVGVSEFGRFVWREGEEHFLTGVNHDERKMRQRRQDRENDYVECGSMYVMSVSSFLAAKSRFCGKIKKYLLRKEQRFEIDDYEDLELMNKIMQFYRIHYVVDNDNNVTNLKLRNVKLIVYDFDGVITDNKVMLCENGFETVVVNRSDGLGVEEIKKLGIKQLILSKEKNEVVKRRSMKLNIPVLNGVEDKKTILLSYCDKHNIKCGEVIYIGNDMNDLEVMRFVGIPICPSDACDEIKAVSKLVLSSKGGEGVVRELYKYMSKLS